MINSQATIYTVAKGNYKFGAYALINSLRACGISNPIVVGTNVLLPELEMVENVIQVVLDSTWNGINLKPVLLLAYPAEYFIYFDADIIIHNGDLIKEVEIQIWQEKFFTCIDGIVAEQEIRRSFWQEIYPLKEASALPTYWYYNSGFFAGSYAKYSWILNDWKELNQNHLDPEAYLFNHPKLPMGDQDTFNAVLQSVPLKQLVSIQMPDWLAMSQLHHPFFHIGNFRPNAFLHCTGKEKPWLFKQVPQRAPNTYDDLWYQYIIKLPLPVVCNFKISYLQKQWYERSILSRIIIKLKLLVR